LCESVKFEDAVRQAAAALAASGIEDARREARILAAHVLGSRTGRVIAADQQVDAAALQLLVARRACREPMAFILGRAGFWTLELEVSPDTLIPRADTETLIDAALTLLPVRDAVRRVLDLGTGTGCLLLSALTEFPAAFGVGVDLSQGAAALARRNAATNGLAARAAFVGGCWSDSLSGGFDLVLSNPPYIRAGDIPWLMPEVAAHEPALALDGGANGLEAYAGLMPRLGPLLAPAGVAILELGEGQRASVSALAQANGLCVIGVRADLAGLDRAIMLRAQPPRGGR
jgi:release factor glutamine methyltransferase